MMHNKSFERTRCDDRAFPVVFAARAAQEQRYVRKTTSKPTLVELYQLGKIQFQN